MLVSLITKRFAGIGLPASEKKRTEGDLGLFAGFLLKFQRRYAIIILIVKL
jgi:hypothetical protein